MFILHMQLASSTLKMEHSVVGPRLVQRLITSRPMVITLQLVTEGSLPNKKVAIGLEDMKTGTDRIIDQAQFRETDPKELLLPQSSK